MAAAHETWRAPGTPLGIGPPPGLLPTPPSSPPDDDDDDDDEPLSHSLEHIARLVIDERLPDVRMPMPPMPPLLPCAGCFEAARDAQALHAHIADGRAALAAERARATAVELAATRAALMHCDTLARERSHANHERELLRQTQALYNAERATANALRARLEALGEDDVIN